MAETMIMKLMVDLECRRCYKKVKKLICKIPEIKESAYREEADTVMIKVVCCCPERIRQKLICEGGKSIRSIEIIGLENSKPAPLEKLKEAADQKPKPVATDKLKEAADQKPKQAATDNPKEAADQKPKQAATDKPKEAADQKPKQAATDKPKEAADQKPKQAAPTPVTGYPPMYPFWGCCRQCFEGRGGGGSCHHGYGIPYQPPYYYGYVRLAPPSYDGWPSGCHCDRSYGCRCEYSTENYPPCAIM